MSAQKPKPKFTIPKDKGKKIDQEKANEFASQALKQEEDESLKPWENPEINTGELKGTLVRVPHHILLKLKYLSENSRIPQQRITREILTKEIERLLEEFEVSGHFKL